MQTLYFQPIRNTHNAQHLRSVDSSFGLTPLCVFNTDCYTLEKIGESLCVSGGRRGGVGGGGGTFKTFSENMNR